jgi:hypothetical protein
MKKIIHIEQIIDRHPAKCLSGEMPIRRNAFRGILDINVSQRFYIGG